MGGEEARMTRIVCPKCDASLTEQEAFEAHMAAEHPAARAALGFGHTLFP